MENEFNPVFKTCGVKMRLTEICHDAGLRAANGMKGKRWRDAYIAKYYATMRKLCPNHPALQEAA